MSDELDTYRFRAKPWITAADLAQVLELVGLRIVVGPESRIDEKVLAKFFELETSEP